MVRQGIRTNIAEDLGKNPVNQSESRHQVFSKSDVQNKDKPPLSKNTTTLDQLESKEKTSSSGEKTANVERKSSSGQNTSPLRNPTTGQDGKKRKSANEFGSGTFWNRPTNTKRKPNDGPEALAALNLSPIANDLIVDTGASHVLFQAKHSNILTSVQMSRPNQNPFAVLRAANGQMLKAIGKGIFTVKSISVVAYLFNDEDLVHNLLGLAPFADCGCEAVFTAHDFKLYHNKDLLLNGKRYSANLWHISLQGLQLPQQQTGGPDQPLEIDSPTITPVLLLHEDTRRDAKYVQFVHACMGSPPPTTFLRAVERGFLSGANQFPRLTSKLVRKHMPNSLATAKGHLNKTATGQPHELSQSVSAHQRYHATNKQRLQSVKKVKPFDETAVPRSTTIHLDYTGRMPTRGSSGTLYFLVACWGAYIHLEPLTNMRGPDTAAAIRSAVLFFRSKNILLDTIRMDNQSSPEVRQTAADLDLEWDLVKPYQKQPNRAERAIRTGKNHIIAIRAGFHKDCPSTLIDRCLFQVELTLNLMHPFEHDRSISAHHGIWGHRFDFAKHPIAPIGAKVLTWDSPSHRGSWADHGIEGVYLGPAKRHFRGFNIWVPQTAAKRVSGTVWWFLKPFLPDDDLLDPKNDHILYPPSRERISPQSNGEDLLGRCFLEPKMGVCCITHLGPVQSSQDKLAPSLHYRSIKTHGEYFATVDQIATWIRDGPLLVKPVQEQSCEPIATVTYPTFLPRSHQMAMPSSEGMAPVSETHTNDVVRENPQPLPTSPDVDAPLPLRRSQRKRKAPDFLKPKFKGKVYIATSTRVSGKQRVPITLEYTGKERVSQPEMKIRRLAQMQDKSKPPAYEEMFWRHRKTLRIQRNKRVGWWDLFHINKPKSAEAMNVNAETDFYKRDMPKPSLPPVLPNGPLNLNVDGSTITYKKSHQGPNAIQWAQADAEELERLFKSGTLRPILFHDIPPDKDATYVNPICSEKLKDDGALKLRTRATIGGDRIDYPYSTTAVTAELESIKILINAMISDNVAFSTVDIEDFYLGTLLPHPEYIRIPAKFIPKKVMRFYQLKKFLHKGAVYCVVLKTHYGLPQAGALSQARLFQHLEQHGYHQLFHAPALFRNKNGTIRFALVVDDFAVVWSTSIAMTHFLRTLRKLYTIKVDYNGGKYLGLTIDIDRRQRHVTLSMPGYVAKLLKRVRPDGIKGATTPSIYTAPNYKKPGTQNATVDVSPLASPAQQHELQVVVGTLLYYARTVDPTILTAVHALGSVQSKPTLNDMRRLERLLQYVAIHQNHGLRFHASTMQLQIQSDASYLCRTKARSVLGGLHYLGTLDQINGPFFCTSKVISCVVSSAAEAELGAAFQNAQKGAQFRNTLIEIGYPQQPTPILVDNTVAEGLARDTINARRSKSMDVRFFWLRDRVRQAQFCISHLAGRFNISDFFTKPLPKEKFDQFKQYLVVDVDENVQRPQRHTVTMDKSL
jgi:hypothetical protein